MFCPFCGEKIPEASVFCPNCGMKMPAAKPAAAPQPAPALQPAPAPRTPDEDAPVITRKPRVEPAPVQDEPVTVHTQRPAAPAAPVAPVEAPVVHTQRPAAPVQQPKPVHTQRPAAPAAPVIPMEPPAQESEELAPADYTVVNVILLIVSLLSCCTCVSIPAIITSIIGIVSGSGCKKAIAAGDMTMAAKKSKTAKIMWIISAVILAISIILGAVVLLLSMGGNGFALMLEDMMSQLNP